MVIDALVEGTTDEVVAKKLIISSGHQFGTIYGKKGLNFILKKAHGFNIRARYSNPILTMIDFMDLGFSCPPEAVMQILPNRSSKMLLCIVVRELESWFLADATGLASFLRIPKSNIPQDPDVVADPKLTLVNLARKSRSRPIRDSIVPPLPDPGIAPAPLSAPVASDASCNGCKLIK